MYLLLVVHNYVNVMMRLAFGRENLLFVARQEML